ncbi:uncharacterized protein LOC125493608 [Beta vulgaris subsp. vulgaris]|uniref:uncharacterized protein LOC125493608 n=1 Tax=Beta vulgaris subsp. vulgaris TaxID=3555 RepID=UPI002036E68C|nr:uncharacterized protein LOC125493608 [Beta vulgaris subsp. vulgaris]
MTPRETRRITYWHTKAICYCTLIRTQYGVREKTTGKLMSIKQGDSESLNDYVGRFNAEAVTIPSLQQEVAVLALMIRLKKKGLLSEATWSQKADKPNRSLGKANDFIQGEDFHKVATAKRPEKDGKEKEKDKFRKDKKPDNSGRREENNSVKKGQQGQSDRYRN